ncbi:hypothetical protein L3Q82_002752 [Scortum barcoo]|uniref:Uncharacterized protein n=1 Tax=Scortum barcoo TaxID=214431 RepID=A0ACB8VUP6_9TELE|nr:hypothetical protein L3Q82_002752 [Scortum barcoo]
MNSLPDLNPREGLSCQPIRSPPGGELDPAGRGGSWTDLAEEGVLSDHVGLWDSCDAVDRYRQAKQATAHLGTVLEAKTRVWEEFGGELLTSTEDIVVGRWKKYFEDLLNPTDLPSSEEAEAGDSEVDSSITQAEVTEVAVRKLLGGKAPGVDEIRPEYLKSLDVVGLSWLTRLCNIAWRLGTVPLEWQTGVVVYARVLERRIRPIVDPRIQEEQCGFRPGRGTLDQLYTLRRVLEGLWEFAQPVHMCFVDLEKASLRLVFDRVPKSWYSVGSAPVACPLRVGGEVLPQVEEFKVGGSQVEDLGVLFTSEGKMEREIDRRIGAASAVRVRRCGESKGDLDRRRLVKKELSRKAEKLSIYGWSIYELHGTLGNDRKDKNRGYKDTWRPK